MSMPDMFPMRLADIALAISAIRVHGDSPAAAGLRYQVTGQWLHACLHDFIALNARSCRPFGFVGDQANDAPGYSDPVRDFVVKLRASRLRCLRSVMSSKTRSIRGRCYQVETSEHSLKTRRPDQKIIPDLKTFNWSFPGAPSPTNGEALAIPLVLA
jgi:hypothetical protein